MRRLAFSSDSAHWRDAARCALLAAAVAVLAACGGGNGGTADPAAGGAAGGGAAGGGAAGGGGGGGGGGAPSPMVFVTLNLEAPAANTPGWVYLHSDDFAIPRATMTRQDVLCSGSGPGNHSCRIGVPRGKVITLVANDNQAQIGFSSVTVNSRNSDPRGIRSQFLEFDGPCDKPEPGVCVFTALADQTITAKYTALQWTQVRFIGAANWRFTIRSRPNLNIASDLQPDPQLLIAPLQTPGLGGCTTETVAVPCYNIISPDGASISFEALPPVGPEPLGSLGPLTFVGFDDPSCGSASACTQVGSSGESVITMKWQYYLCTAPNGTTSASNPIWNTGAVIAGGQCVLVTP